MRRPPCHVELTWPVIAMYQLHLTFAITPIWPQSADVLLCCDNTSNFQYYWRLSWSPEFAIRRQNKNETQTHGGQSKSLSFPTHNAFKITTSSRFSQIVKKVSKLILVVGQRSSTAVFVWMVTARTLGYITSVVAYDKSCLCFHSAIKLKQDRQLMLLRKERRTPVNVMQFTWRLKTGRKKTLSSLVLFYFEKINIKSDFRLKTISCL